MNSPANVSSQAPLLPPEPWYKSEVQVRAVIALLLQGVSIGARYVPWLADNLDRIVADATQIVAIIFAAMAIMKRKDSPIQPLTFTAAQAEQRADSARLDPMTLKEKGMAHVGALTIIILLFVATQLTMFTGCASSGTRHAWQEADTADEYAYVLAEQYASLVKEAADLAEKPTTSEQIKAMMKSADAAVNPKVTMMRTLRDAYMAVDSAENEAQLQQAVNDVVLLLSDMVRAVNAAKGEAGG